MNPQTLTTTTSDFETGSYTNNVSVYLADGSVVTGAGAGVLKSAGGHSWQLNGTDVVSDGAVIASEGILTLSERTLNGKIFEIT